MSLLGGITLGSTPARATADGGKTNAELFALVIGVNQGSDPRLPALRYADDDAVRFEEIFRLVGAHSQLLTTLDEPTQRLSRVTPNGAPRKDELERAVLALRSDVAAAHARGHEAILYFAYAGHGDVPEQASGSIEDEGALLLEDGRLGSEDIERGVIDRIAADETHLIVDACYSYFLAYGRGPGGTRRAVRGFVPRAGLAHRPDVGLLLSTTSTRQSHEWEGFQAGVFSHEVRSGLLGAADLDGDGVITYLEITAFVIRANGAIPNDRFRPDVLAHPPKSGTMLKVVPREGQRCLLVDALTPSAHYLLEDGAGTRLADFHNAPHHAVRILVPRTEGPLFLRRFGDERELVIEPGADDVRFVELTEQASHVTARGAAHQAFVLTFSLPYDETALSAAAGVASGVGRGEPGPEPSSFFTRRRVGVGLLVVGGLTLTAAGVATRETMAAQEASTSEPEQTKRGDAINRYDRLLSLTWKLYVAGLVTTAAGAVVTWVPFDGWAVSPLLGSDARSVALAGRF